MVSFSNSTLTSSVRQAGFGQDFEDGVSGNAIIVLGKQFLLESELGHLLEEIFDVRGG